MKNPEYLADLLKARGINQQAAAVLAGVDQGSISKICTGRVKARPVTIVKLAQALGIAPKRMQSMCNAHWLAAHPDEALVP
jgi:transcriptional regulator with XRE-family HTH domain